MRPITENEAEKIWDKIVDVFDDFVFPDFVNWLKSLGIEIIEKKAEDE